MVIEVMRFPALSDAHAVDALLRGCTVFCAESGEGWQLCEPGELPHPHYRSKRAIHHFLSARRRWVQDYFEVREVHWIIEVPCGD